MADSRFKSESHDRYTYALPKYQRAAEALHALVFSKHPRSTAGIWERDGEAWRGGRELGAWAGAWRAVGGTWDPSGRKPREEVLEQMNTKKRRLIDTR